MRVFINKQVGGFFIMFFFCVDGHFWVKFSLGYRIKAIEFRLETLGQAAGLFKINCYVIIIVMLNYILSYSWNFYVE